MNHAGEGVIKFHLEHTQTPALPVEETAELRAWFAILRQTDLLGQHPDRYEGYAYGNISQRGAEGFIISCTQTSGQQRLNAEDFSCVTSFDLGKNHLKSRGPCKPSSEAMTHGAVYQAAPQAKAVFHAHCPSIWHNAEILGLPVTDPAIEYGTPEMAEAVQRLLATNHAPRIFSMGGHEDGIVAWGESPDKAGSALLQVFSRSLT
ncbi:class II aldolase/adducin family protein [Thiolapillus sp.]